MLQHSIVNCIQIFYIKRRKWKRSCKSSRKQGLQIHQHSHYKQNNKFSQDGMPKASVMAALWVRVLPPSECHWLVDASPLNYGRWVGQNSGPIFHHLWTKVHQIKFACAGMSIVCNAIFWLTVTCCIREIFAIKSQNCPKSHQNLMFWAAQFWVKGPQMSDWIS